MRRVKHQYQSSLNPEGLWSCPGLPLYKRKTFCRVKATVPLGVSPHAGKPNAEGYSSFWAEEWGSRYITSSVWKVKSMEPGGNAWEGDTKQRPSRQLDTWVWSSGMRGWTNVLQTCGKWVNSSGQRFPDAFQEQLEYKTHQSNAWELCLIEKQKETLCFSPPLWSWEARRNPDIYYFGLRFLEPVWLLRTVVSNMLTFTET